MRSRGISSAPPCWRVSEEKPVNIPHVRGGSGVAAAAPTEEDELKSEEKSEPDLEQLTEKSGRRETARNGDTRGVDANRGETTADSGEWEMKKTGANKVNQKTREKVTGGRVKRTEAGGGDIILGMEATLGTAASVEEDEALLRIRNSKFLL